MKLPGSETNSIAPDDLQAKNLAVAGPSNGHSAPLPSTSNGVSNGRSSGFDTPSSSVSRVNLPGDTLYDDSSTSREEFVRLAIQSLRDVGYIESAATLEAESGYTMEAPQVSEFRRHVLEGSWSQAEESLGTLGVSDESSYAASRFLISQQKYLELLEVRNFTRALHILRTELAPLTTDLERLRTLSSLMMCSTPEDLLEMADWDGARGTSRRRLLMSLQKYIPSAMMIPARRLQTLVEQACAYQRISCMYHNSSGKQSLYADHECSRADFPTMTTNILLGHEDEVWHLQWSHDGRYLATASKDRTAIIWRIGPSLPNAIRECSLERVLREHPYPVNCIAWSTDDRTLITTSHYRIKMWNVKTGLCTREITEGHLDVVNAIAWLPNNKGFVSGGMDRKVNVWSPEGELRDTLSISIRVADLAVTPDVCRVVVVGLDTVRDETMTDRSGEHSQRQVAHRIVHKMVVYDLQDKREEIAIKFDGELTSIKMSLDSRYALINHSPAELQMWDLQTARMTRKFTGQRQGSHIIRSCFGGAANNFVVSGSEDAKVYVWHRDSGVLLEILEGHGPGSVNSVVWHPHEANVFASCSDDRTIRIWEPQSAISSMDSITPSASGETLHIDKGKTRPATSSVLNPITSH